TRLVFMVVLDLEVELVLYVNTIFDQFLAESRLTFKRKPIGCAPAASHGDVGVIDYQAVVVGAVEAVIEGGSELIGEILLLFRRGIENSITERDFQFPGDDVLSALDVPAPGLPERHRGPLDRGCRDCRQVEGLSS